MNDQDVETRLRNWKDSELKEVTFYLLHHRCQSVTFTFLIDLIISVLRVRVRAVSVSRVISGHQPQ